MPRQLSGGQKQRIGVARAFAGNAKVVVADEPVSALDVSVQAAVTELLMDIQRKNKTTMLFISHDLSVVRYIADRVVVMYLGHIVEQGTTDQIFSPPYHPYTEALLSAIPIADTSVVKKHIVLEGDIPSAMNPPSGCPFQTRCRYKSAGAGQSLRDRGAAGAQPRRRPPGACAGCPTRCSPRWSRSSASARTRTMRPDTARPAPARASSARRRSGRAARPPRRKPRPQAKASRNPKRRRGCAVKIVRKTAPRPANATQASRRPAASRLGQPDRRRRRAVAVRADHRRTRRGCGQEETLSAGCSALAGRDARQAHRVRQRAAADSGRPPPARRTRGKSRAGCRSRWRSAWPAPDRLAPIP